ncbi:hypothetical protein A3E15_03350 [Candidatus Woesebacteria bacterium RIFCSPHIGHO2_12_FULL_42_9]|uniref:Uncharacterized protein n=3 Tax=Candidatus Woeseibacteriota TaxID=1752722 RepID=A0A1F8AQI3_9BACT|nr:MAG: hypothetical protein A2112_00740 [Candidatus Woesebacteria bacterium GWA1_42_12]OGM06768.1 MAG: hypothetical protein A2129_01060 [Candidatus Woesebacteria bacterium GWC1_42_13]OGM54032.1 MAG: hypothetical protein A3E15_03350 [Candidatus Woesebacteria bacterium RIFCSPHIGHO2_12_FULL_42_9]
MSKRKKFLITSGILSLGFFMLQFLKDQNKFIAVGGLGVLTVVLFFWALREGLAKDMTMLTLILPFLFTLGVGTFWFLLPVSFFTRLPIVVVYLAGIYVLCLTANIYTVAAIRTIALLRAARGVGFVLTLIISFLIFDAILSLKLMPWFTAPLVSLSSFLFFSQGLWVISLEKEFSKNLVLISAILGLVMGEIAVSLFFWPTTVVVGSLFLTVSLYMLLGLGQAKLEERLFPSTVREYLIVGVLVFIGMFFATRWGG